MNPKDEELLGIVNASGFLFQLRVEQEVRDTYSSHRKEVLAHEHRWVDPLTHLEGFIDLIISAGTNAKMVIECKRVRDAEWVFLVPDEARATRSVRVLWTGRSKERNCAAWDRFMLRPESLEAEFCIVRGQGDTQQPMLERLASNLLASSEALAEEELGYHREEGIPGGLQFYYPVLVTTATLRICRFHAGDIDLPSGELNEAGFEEVPFIRFTKSLSSTLSSSRFPSRLEEAAQEGHRTAFVVNAGQLVQFLKGRWEFDPPRDGSPWPWDLPRWREVP